MKTNAARILDRLKIAYTLREYAVDTSDLSAEAVAAKVGMPLCQTYKTLLCKGDRSGYVFAVVAGSCELNLKRLAAAAGDRACEMASLREVQPQTGYVRGGVTVLGAKKPYPAYIDSAVLELPLISVSGGMRGLQIIIEPGDYIRATAARVVEQLGRLATVSIAKQE